MDPDETLRLLRLANTSLDHQIESGNIDLESLALHAAAMAHSFRALDEWMTRGGFAPQAWSRTEAAEQTPQQAHEGAK